MADRIVLSNGMLADGSGGPILKADLLVEGPIIREIGMISDSLDAKRIDCSNLIVAPGFIDAHSHSDLQVLQNKPEKVLQGVTSEVVGNCGFSPYPSQNRTELQDFGNGILCGDDGWGWSSAADYLLEVHSRARLASVYSLVGHGSLRIAVAGPQQGPVSEELLAVMESTLDEALTDGATGFSTGLMYAPGSSAPKEELERLCRVVAKRGKIYCTHMRNYSTRLLEALDEQIDLAKATGCRLQISHLQAVGRENWKLNAIALERIEAAKRAGIDIKFDCYPYLAGSTVLTQLLPQWSLEGGPAALITRLSSGRLREEIRIETLAVMVHEWSDIFISALASEKNSTAIGKSLAELSMERGEHPLDVAFSLLVDENCAVNMLQFNQSEENLRSTLCHPLAIVISDGFYVKGKPHPRLHGTFPELLGNICREKGWMTLTEGIYKVTGAPAERFGMKKCGFLQPSFSADITVFDAVNISSPATYKQPNAKPKGVIGVIRGGRILFWNGDSANHVPIA